MSSHHIIRENQEPALFILGEISFPIVEPLLEWSPLVMVADTVLDTVIFWGIKIDVVVARDTTEVAERMKDQAPLKVLSYHNDDLLENALQYLTTNKHKAVHIAAPDSADLQKQLMELATPMQVTLLENSMHWLLIANGNFKKWMPQGAFLTVAKKHPGQKIETEGVDLNLHSVVTEKEGFITIQSSEPFWVGESI